MPTRSADASSDAEATANACDSVSSAVPNMSLAVVCSSSAAVATMFRSSSTPFESRVKFFSKLSKGVDIQDGFLIAQKF